MFVLWVTLIHLLCWAAFKLARKDRNVRDLGVAWLLLTTNNTGAEAPALLAGLPAQLLCAHALTCVVLTATPAHRLHRLARAHCDRGPAGRRAVHAAG